MKYVFTLDKKSFSKRKELFSSLTPLFFDRGVSDGTAYNTFLRELIQSLKTVKEKNRSFPLFKKEVQELSVHSPLIEITPWGGVSIKKVDTAKGFIQKLLIIRQYGILGFEIHNKKLEKLHILEGECLLISSLHASETWQKGIVSVSFGEKGKKVVLNPGDEHGIIALTNCVIEETSTNNLDDIVFIFPSEQVN